MPRPLVCRKKAKLLAFILFLSILAIVSYTGNWWPGMLLAIGVPLAVKQGLLGKHYDTGVTLFVFLGGFCSLAFDIQWQIFLPILFTLGGIYILYRDLLEGTVLPETEEELDINETIEEEQHK